MTNPRPITVPVGTTPLDKEAEQRLLAALLIDPEHLPAVLRELPAGAESFFLNPHRVIFQAILDLDERGEPVSVSSVADLLSQRAGRHANQLDEVGGAAYLVGLETELATTTFTLGYARRVARDHARRQVIDVALRAVAMARDGVENGREFLLHVEALFADLTNHLGNGGSALTPAEVSARALDIIATRAVSDPGVPTGIPVLDDLVGGGLRYGELVSIGAKPSFGKSAMLLAIARGYAKANRRGAAFIAGEQSAEELIVRQLAARAKVSANSLAPEPLGNSTVRDRFERAAHALADDGVHMYDPRPFTLAAVLRASREAVQRHGCGLVAWDYGQIIDAGTGDTRTDVLRVTRAAKQFAQQHEVIVLLAGQLLQTAQGRPNREQFKESKSFSEDSDICLLLHRPDMQFCDEDARTLHVEVQGQVPRGTTLVICDKLRRGLWGPDVLATMRYDGPKFRYHEEDALQAGLL